MLLKGEQLAAHLERELRPLYVLYGDEPLLVLEAADAIRKKSRQQRLLLKQPKQHRKKR
jgi:DNA polymerase-3 subunit delta